MIVNCFLITSSIKIMTDKHYDDSGYILVGIDYSYTSPALTILDNGIYHSYALWHNKTLPIKDTNIISKDNFNIYLDFYDKVIVYRSEIERYKKLADWAIQKIRSHNANDNKPLYIAIEGYSIGSRAGLLFNIAENTAILKSGIIDILKPDIFLAYPPTYIKKNTTGKGTAKKHDMGKAFFDRNHFYVHEILKKKSPDSNPSSDIVDSFYILTQLERDVKSFFEKNTPINSTYKII